MIYYGTNIQSSADLLKPVELDYIVNALRNPQPQMAARIRQLRIIRQIDPKQYVRTKKSLPYFVCGNFNPPYRKTENFAYIEHFVVDIDDIAENNIDLLNLRNQLKADSRTEMLFASPSLDGLKVMFRLKERCYDHGLFSTFYKEFVRKLGAELSIESAIDTRTSDVCRACFISIDADVYHNPEPALVDINEYLNMSNPEDMFSLKEQLDQYDKEREKEEKSKDDPYDKADPADMAMDKIKGILAKQREQRAKNPSEIYVPEELEAFIGGVKAYIEDNGVEVYEISNIQYGKKIKCKLGFRQAELNLFYGKKGFSVVASPKSGVSPELNAVLAELLQNFVDDNS